MLISRRSPLTGKINVREIDINEHHLFQWQHGGGLIQDVMPHISADDREFLMSGATPEDWAKMFPPEEGESLQ